jgi:hypothetical protein
MSNLAHFASGLNADEQVALANMPTKYLACVISFVEQTGMPVGAILDLQELPANQHFVPRWNF